MEFDKSWPESDTFFQGKIDPSLGLEISNTSLPKSGISLGMCGLEKIQYSSNIHVIMLFMGRFCSHLYQLHTRIIPSFSPWHPFHSRSIINCRFLDDRTVSLFKTSEKSGNWVTPAPHHQRNRSITLFKQLDTLIFQRRFSKSSSPIKPKLKMFLSHEAFSKWAEKPISAQWTGQQVGPDRLTTLDDNMAWKVSQRQTEPLKNQELPRFFILQVLTK